MGDLLLPGFASMVHGELGNASCEIATMHGVCASGVMALKHAWLQIRAGEKRTAAACASEFASRALKASHYQTQDLHHGRLGFETAFLRWMLSDGAGAAVLQDHPDPRRPSLRIDWIELKSYADRFDVCMYTGGPKDGAGEIPLFGGTVQCASCHDPHDNTNAPFLRKTNTASALCSTCHQK